MNFSYTLFTGDSTVTGSASDMLAYNLRAFMQEDYTDQIYITLDNDGAVKNNPFHVLTDIVTGQYSSTLSWNSQTLIEGGFDIYTGKNKNYYSIEHGGNYVIDTENSDGKIIFDYNVEVNNTDTILYDRREYQSGVQQYKLSADNFPSEIANLYNKIDSLYDNLDNIPHMFDLYHIFINGQKIEYGEYPDNSSTGHIFAIPKRTGCAYQSSSYGDVYGTGFVEHNVDFYLNGLEQTQQDFMQMYTGVYMIETGVQCSISSINLQTETYSL